MPVIHDPNLRHKLEELAEDLGELVKACDRAIADAKKVLEDAGVKVQDVNSPHIYESQAVKSLAQDILRIHKGQYTWNLPQTRT